MMPMPDKPHVSADRDRIVQGLRRWRRREERDEGPHGALWHGIGAIRQIAGGARAADKEATRGQLIKLVAAGEVEVCEFVNGVAWRSARPLYLVGIR
jgi:hypothetical protein